MAWPAAVDTFSASVCSGGWPFLLFHFDSVGFKRKLQPFTIIRPFLLARFKGAHLTK